MNPTMASHVEKVVHHTMQAESQGRKHLGHGIYSETEMRADKRFKKSSDKIGIKSR
jgi:hypothetical protein